MLVVKRPFQASGNVGQSREVESQSTLPINATDVGNFSTGSRAHGQADVSPACTAGACG